MAGNFYSRANDYRCQGGRTARRQARGHGHDGRAPERQGSMATGRRRIRNRQVTFIVGEEQRGAPVRLLQGVASDFGGAMLLDTFFLLHLLSLSQWLGPGD